MFVSSLDSRRRQKRSAKIWQYVIRGAGADGADSETFGPFSTDQMLEWEPQLSAAGNVDVRLTVGRERRWRPISSIKMRDEVEAMK